MLLLRTVAKHSACIIGLAVAHRVVLTVLACLLFLGLPLPGLVLVFFSFADLIAKNYHLWSYFGPLAPMAGFWLGSLLWSTLVYSSYVTIDRSKSKKEEKKQAERRQAVSALRDNVLPAVREVAAVVRQNGHQAEVIVNLLDPDAPSISLVLTVEVRKSMRSELTFQHDVGRRELLIRVSEKHETARTCNGGLSPGGSMSAVSISDEETKRRITEFIEHSREEYSYAS
jgi:hypothetical protein